MWKRIKDTEYYLMFSQESGYEICITDYLSVWTTMFSEKSFLAQLKESNDGLELPHEKEFIQKGVAVLSNIDNLKKFGIEKKENGKEIFITMTVSFGFPFFFECTLSKGLEEVYFQKVTLPLLKVICDLRESQSELRHLLMKKDSEIEEYKCEGGEIVLRHLKTVAFNDVEHMKKHKEFEERFGASNTSTKSLEEAIDIMEKNVLKQKPIATQNQDPGPSIKAEPETVIKTEPGLSVKMDIENSVTTDIIPSIKEEPNSEVAEESNAAVITTSIACKQKIKREHARAHVPKRWKFNF